MLMPSLKTVFGVIFAAIIVSLLIRSASDYTDATEHRAEAAMSEAVRSAALRVQASLDFTTALVNNIATLDVTAETLEKGEKVAILRDSVSLHPEVVHMGVFDRQGKILFDTGINGTGRIVKPMVPVAKGAELMFSQAHQSRLNGQWVITLTRPIISSGGEQNFYAFAEVSLQRLGSLFDGIALGLSGGVELLSNGQQVLIHRTAYGRLSIEPYQQSLLLGLNENSRQALLSDVFVASLPETGEDNVIAYQKLADYPFYLIAYRPMGDFSQGWIQSLELIGFVLLVVLAALLLGALSMRSLREKLSLAQSDARALAIQVGHARVELEDRNARLQDIWDNTPDVVLVVDAHNSQILECNPTAERVLQARKGDILGKTILDFSPEYQADGRLTAEAAPQLVEEIIQRGYGQFEWLHQNAAGQFLEMDVQARVASFRGSEVFYITWRDVAERKKLERELSEKNQRLEAVWNNSPDAFLVVTPDDGLIHEASASAERMLETTRDKILGATVMDFTPKRQANGKLSSDLAGKIIDQIRQQGNGRFEWQHQTASGEAVWVDVSVEVGEFEGREVFYSTWRDIGEYKRLEHEFAQLAHYDALTGLPNRRQLQAHFEHAYYRAERMASQLFLLFIDLDNFKYVNDVHGHSVGDQLLVSVVDRFNKILRQEDIFARLGGDEFVLMLESAAHENDAIAVAEKLLALCKQPLVIDGQKLMVGMSIGIARCPHDGTDYDELLSKADAAMYHAKANGRGQYQFFSQAMRSSAADYLDTEVALAEAIDENRFELLFQPQLSMEQGRLVGVEALLRWNDPERGYVAPDLFLPIAENLNLMSDIEQWVFDEACKHAQAWASTGLVFGKLAINTSKRSLVRQYAASHLRQALANSGCPPSLIEVEVSEDFDLPSTQHGLAELAKIQALGVDVVLDDFGLGQTSLTHLKRLPLSKLKIDRSFVRDLGFDDSDRAIVSATIAMGKKLHLVTTAEGVETEEQAAFLREESCDIGQGYLVSKPLKAADFEQWYDSSFERSDQRQRVVPFARSDAQTEHD